MYKLHNFWSLIDQIPFNFPKFFGQPKKCIFITHVRQRSMIIINSGGVYDNMERAIGNYPKKPLYMLHFVACPQATKQHNDSVMIIKHNSFGPKSVNVVVREANQPQPQPRTIVCDVIIIYNAFCTHT